MKEPATRPSNPRNRFFCKSVSKDTRIVFFFNTVPPDKEPARPAPRSRASQRPEQAGHVKSSTIRQILVVNIVFYPKYQFGSGRVAAKTKQLSSVGPSAPPSLPSRKARVLMVVDFLKNISSLDAGKKCSKMNHDDNTTFTHTYIHVFLYLYRYRARGCVLLQRMHI